MSDLSPFLDTKTERLSIIPWRRAKTEDIELWLSRSLTENVVKHLPDSWSKPRNLPRSGLEVWRREREEKDKAQIAAVFTQSDGELIGLVTLFLDSSTSGEGGHQQLSLLRIGYVLGESAWGKGFATEICQSIVSIAKQQGNKLGIDGLRACTTSENAASSKVLLKAGFTLDTIENKLQHYSVALE